MSRYNRDLSRRELLLGALVLPTVGLAACGEGRAGPPLAAATVPTIRVRLGRPRPQAELTLAAGPWEIHSVVGTPYSLRTGGPLSAALGLGAVGIAIAGRDTQTTQLRVRTPSSFTLDGTTYPGVLLVRRDGNVLVFVNETDLETYTAGVIPNECAPGAEPATHRSQAVASRTYAYVRVTAPGAERAAFHVQDSESSQVYRGFAVAPTFGATSSDMLARAAETRGVLLTWQSRPFSAYFASTCGGHTTEARTSGLDPEHAEEVLRGVRCGFCSTSPKYRWTRRVSDADLIEGLKRVKLPASAPLETVEVASMGRGDWVREVVLVGGPQRSRRSVPGPAFRTAAGLPSHHLLALRRVEGGLEIDGAGWGHGVGMCQWGAFEMGKRGFSETDILRAYYPGISFARVY